MVLDDGVQFSFLVGVWTLWWGSCGRFLPCVGVTRSFVYILAGVPDGCGLGFANDIHGLAMVVVWLVYNSNQFIVRLDKEVLAL